jgi:hypothetical protein
VTSLYHVNPANLRKNRSFSTPPKPINPLPNSIPDLNTPGQERGQFSDEEEDMDSLDDFMGELSDSGTVIGSNGGAEVTIRVGLA